MRDIYYRRRYKDWFQNYKIFAYDTKNIIDMIKIVNSLEIFLEISEVDSLKKYFASLARKTDDCHLKFSPNFDLEDFI